MTACLTMTVLAAVPNFRSLSVSHPPAFCLCFVFAPFLSCCVILPPVPLVLALPLLEVTQPFRPCVCALFFPYTFDHLPCVPLFGIFHLTRDMAERKGSEGGSSRHGHGIPLASFRKYPPYNILSSCFGGAC